MWSVITAPALNNELILVSNLQQLHKDWRQGVRVQPQFPADPAHEAGEPSLPAGAAGSVYAGELHRDPGWAGGPAPGCCGQHGETRPGGAQGDHAHSGS